MQRPWGSSGTHGDRCTARHAMMSEQVRGRDGLNADTPMQDVLNDLILMFLKRV